MTRNEEYQALLQELETTPAALDGAVERALRRRKRDRRLRLFGVPAGSLAACFAAFVLLVNLFPPFARACGSVPVLRELAQAVAWSPSLSAAVENDYVQPIGQSQTVNGVTATVEYVIVDRKQLNIFYTLDYAPDLGPMWADCRITPGDGSAGDAGGRTEKPVHLEFDPYFTAQGTLLELNRTFALDGQTFTLQEAEIYPTHLRLTLTADPDNTAWLAGLDLYLENEHGERFEKSLGGITASGDPEGEGMGTFWLDSPFFSQGEHLTLHITGVRWKDKDAPPVKLNLAEGTAENLPEGTWFQGAKRLPEGWIVYLVSPLMENRTMGSVFSRGAWDEDGNYYEIWQFGSSYGYWDETAQERVGEDRWYTEDFPLAGLAGDTAYLDPCYNRMAAVDAAVPIQ